jgi:hypothetical protein
VPNIELYIDKRLDNFFANSELESMKNILILIAFLSAAANAMTGHFIIPIDDPSLVPLSDFRVNNIKISPDSLSFTMPPEIASAVAYEVKFERNDVGVNTLNSYFGRAHCLQADERSIRCKINYNSLYQKVLIENLYKTMDYVQRNTQDIHELTDRLLVAEWFAGNPSGILYIEIGSI